MSHRGEAAALEIDLSVGQIDKKQNDPKLYETYLGGKGIGTKLLWDKVPPETAPLSPENLLIFTTCLLTGTPAPTANRACISYKSPQINLFSYSYLGGFWPAELRHAGYDTVVISGKSPSPIYLWVDNDNVEIRDASRLWGKDTRETQKALREELRNDKVQIVCIGPAGENMVHMASLEHGTNHSASRTGIGAVMGSKNLKAIAVHGTKDVHIAMPTEFMEVCEHILKRSEGIKKWFDIERWCHDYVQPACDTACFGNEDEMPPGSEFENYAEINKDYLARSPSRDPACYNCSVSCPKLQVSLPERTHFYPMCMSFAFSFACKIPDLAFTLECYELCVRYGLDLVSTAKALAFAIDLYQRGILTKEDTDRLHLEYGNKELAFILIDKIARRDGIGNVLADGVYTAAKVIGKGAEEHAHLVKGLDLSPDFKRLKPSSAVFIATSDRADLHGCTCATLPYTWGDRREVLKDGWWLYPKEFEKYLESDPELMGWEGAAELTYYTEHVRGLVDLAGVCWWWAGFWPYTVIKIDAIIALIRYATRMDIDEAGAIKIAERVRTLHQANNVRLGLRRKHDTIPAKLFRDEPTRHQKEMGLIKLEPKEFNKQLDKYYELRGWNSEGIPTKETLDKLDLGYVRHDLERMGIL